MSSQRFDHKVLALDTALSIASAVVSSALGASWLGSLILAALAPALLTYVHHPGENKRRRTALGLGLYALLHLLQALLARVRGRPVGSRVAAGWGHGLRFAELTACLAFAITVVTLTAPELVLGDALVSDRPLTLLPAREPASCPLPAGRPTERETGTTAAEPKRRKKQPKPPRRDPVTPAPSPERPHPPSLDPTAPPPDRTAPTLELPDDITVRARDRRGAVVRYSARAVDGKDGRVAVSCRPAAGSRFPVGTTTARCEARDRAGNAAHGSFAVRVTAPPAATRTPTPPTPTPTPPAVTPEPEPPPAEESPQPPPEPADDPPQFTGPSEIVATTRRRPPTRVRYPLPPATDDHDPQPLVACDPSTVPAGTTATVSCTARDSAGNSAGQTFHVTIQSAGGG